MNAEDAEKITAHLAGNPESEFPNAATPNVFADGVTGYAPMGPTIRFFLYRNDPNMFGRGGFKPNPFAQVVMPTHGFAQTAALFHHAVKKLIAANVVTQAEYDKMLADIVQVNRREEETKSA